MCMLEPKYIRENLDFLKKDYKRRKDKNLMGFLDEFMVLDEKVRALKVDIDGLRKKRNEYSQEINKLRKEGKEVDGVLKKVKALPDKIRKKELDYNEKLKRLSGVYREGDRKLYSGRKPMEEQASEK